MRMGVLTALVRFNAAHPWPHNDAFTPYILRQARAVRRNGGDTAVDVGCGTGTLVERLASIFPWVIGIEPDHDTATVADQRLKNADSVRIFQRRFGDEPTARYDLIVFVASLHHMPLRATLFEAKSAIRTGGRIVIVGLAREFPNDAWRSLVSLLLNPIVGFIRHPARAVRQPVQMRAPTAPATDSFEEIQAIADEVLPGIRLHRRLFWRYTATWIAPS